MGSENAGVIAIILLMAGLSVTKISPDLSDKIFGGLFDIMYDFAAGFFKLVFGILIKIIKRGILLGTVYFSKVKRPVPVTGGSNIQCPCCGYFSVKYDEMTINICGICGWQYDITGQKYSDKTAGSNDVSLNEARKNYKLYKVSDRKFLKNNWLREPLVNELPENNI